METSVVIDVINQIGVAAFETKRQSPVPVYGDRPVFLDLLAPRITPCDEMQAPSRDVHISA
jgi:hypothetical protein